jgi:acetoacetyl-CoA synthetase
MDDWAVYNGKTIDLREKMADVVKGMTGVEEFAGVISMPRFRNRKPADVTNVPNARLLQDFMKQATSKKLQFEKTSFRDPFLIAYSSGTTGTPKCIVHSIGGVLVNAAKEGILHRELNPDSVALQYTTTGWIMYLSSVTSLLSGARLILYDGSPFIGPTGQHDLTTFVKLIGEQRVTKLGTSPRWMAELQKGNIIPQKVTDLSHLKMVTSTGMVLSDQLFEWFYDVGFPPHVHLANISGGTDIAGCFGMENPLNPVYVGGTQGPALGIKVEVYDSLIEGGRGVMGSPVPHGTPGELVATQSFPNMPVYFYNDPDGSRYFSAYFEKYDNVWTHGDFIMIHPVTKSVVFLGRADGVLNPSGVRFGSAEIYGVLEHRFPQIADSICVGQRRPSDQDESVMLFLLMRQGEKFTPQLVNEVKSAIRKELSARHVPTYVFETPEIPVSFWFPSLILVGGLEAWFKC